MSARADSASLPRGSWAIPSRLREPRLRGTPFARSALAHGLYALILRPTAALLHHLGVTANAVTLLSLVTALASGVALGMGAPGVGALLLVFTGVLDLLDGALARTSLSVSSWGAILDSTVDRVADAAPLLGIALYYSPRGWLQLPALVLLVAGFVISYVRARAESLGVRMPPLPMQRAERLLATVACAALGLLETNSLGALPWMGLGVTVTAALTLAGAVYALVVARDAATQLAQTSDTPLPSEARESRDRAA